MSKLVLYIHWKACFHILIRQESIFYAEVAGFNHLSLDFVDLPEVASSLLAAYLRSWLIAIVNFHLLGNTGSNQLFQASRKNISLAVWHGC